MAAVQQVGPLTIYRFPASLLGGYAEPLTGPGMFRPLGVVEALSGSGAEAVLNGPMFQLCAPGGYPATTCERPEYLLHDARSGVDIRGIHPRDGMTVSVLQGKVLVRDGAMPISGAPVAVQLYPELVRNGEAVPVGNTESNNSIRWRSALAVISQTELAFIIGRMDLHQFASALAGYGVTDAGYTDGGGSTAFATRTTYYGDTEHRRVPVWLTAGGGANGGSALGTYLVVGGLAYAAYWYFTQQRRRRRY